MQLSLSPSHTHTHTQQYELTSHVACVSAGQSEGFGKPTQPRGSGRFQPYPARNSRSPYNRGYHQIRGGAYPEHNHMPEYGFHPSSYNTQWGAPHVDPPNQSMHSNPGVTTVTTDNSTDAKQRTSSTPSDVCGTAVPNEADGFADVKRKKPDVAAFFQRQEDSGHEAAKCIIQYENRSDSAQLSTHADQNTNTSQVAGRMASICVRSLLLVYVNDWQLPYVPN